MDNCSEPTVRILLASYNGEKYIYKQIKSIISQTYSNWSLFIQDDGSTDETVSIISSFDDDRIEYCVSTENKHGPLINFHSISNKEKLSGKKYDYYMFCDQDDIWDNDKIERMVARIKNTDESIPRLYNADMRIIDADDNTTAPSICKLQGLRYNNVYSLFFSFFVYGCNTIMNRAAFFSVPVIDLNEKWAGLLHHDSLYPIFAGVLGEIKYIPETTMSYRRHNDNFTSSQKYGFGIKRIVKRLFDINSLAKDQVAVYNQGLMIITLLKDHTDNKILNEIENAILTGGFPALRFMKKNNISCGNYIKNTSRKIVLLSKRYLQYIVKYIDE